jgi:hypothetical protein
MDHCKPRAEALAQPADELRRERDFGNEQQRLPAALDFRGDQAQKHFRLAAAGDAVEQEGAEALRALLERGERRGLIGRELRHRRVPARGLRRVRKLAALDPPAARKSIEHGRCGPSVLELADADRRVRRQCGEHGGLAPADARGLGAHLLPPGFGQPPGGRARRGERPARAQRRR